MKKNIIIISLVLIATGLVLMGTSAALAQTSDSFTIPLSEPGKRGKLNASINYGSIIVKGTARKDVLIKYTSHEEGKKQSKAGEVDGMRRIGGGGLNLQATENGNFVKVKSDSWTNKLNLEIEVPSGFDLQLHTYNNGDLEVENIQGELELKNYNGAISALNISGTVVASTYNGKIKVTFDKVTEGKPMSYSTYNGDIDLTFPASYKASLKMKTERGEIYSNFDVDFKSSGPVQKKDTESGVYKVVIDEWRRGDLNGGGPEITMRNYNGDVYVRKK